MDNTDVRANPEASPVDFDTEEDIKKEAIAEAIAMMAQQGYVITPERLTEALGPEQLRLIGQSINLSEELTESQLVTIAENIPEGSLTKALERSQADTQATNMTQNGDAVQSDISQTLLKHPAAALYAISVGVLMTAMYLSSPIVALAGIGILLITVLHYAA